MSLDNDSSVYFDNSQLIYEYTEKLLKTRIENVDILNTRLIALLAGNTGMIKLSADIAIIHPIVCYQPIVKIACFCCALLSSIVIISSFLTKLKGTVADPYVIAGKDHRHRDPAELRAFIMSYWAHSINEYERHIKAKSLRVNLAVFLFLSSIVLFSIAHIPLVIK